MKAYDLVIENARILTMDAGGTLLENGVIGVQNRSISLLEKQTPDFCCQARQRIDEAELHRQVLGEMKEIGSCCRGGSRFSGA